jgi:hypothetical protein
MLLSVEKIGVRGDFRMGPLKDKQFDTNKVLDGSPSANDAYSPELLTFQCLELIPSRRLETLCWPA